MSVYFVLFLIFNITIYYRSEESNSRPQHTIEDLIIMALQGLKKKSTTNQIINWIKDNFIYYKKIENEGWIKSVKNCLSAKKKFIKLRRNTNDGPGKESFWTLDPENS